VTHGERVLAVVRVPHVRARDEELLGRHDGCHIASRSLSHSQSFQISL
jgi:hypothetical protein